MSTFVLPTLFSPPVVADTRGGDTSVARQLHYVLGCPFSYAVVLIRNVMTTIESSLLGSFCNFAYLGNGTLSLLSAVLVAGVTLTDTYSEGNETVLSKKNKIVSGSVMAVVVALIWTALYLSFTEVGNTVISGVQSRYYWPFLFLFYLCFQSQMIKNKLPVEKYQMCIMLLSSSILFWQIYKIFLVQRCL